MKHDSNPPPRSLSVAAGICWHAHRLIVCVWVWLYRYDATFWSLLSKRLTVMDVCAWCEYTCYREWRVVFNTWWYPSQVNNTVRMCTSSIGHNLHRCYESSQITVASFVKPGLQNSKSPRWLSHITEESEKKLTFEILGAAGAFK